MSTAALLVVDFAIAAHAALDEEPRFVTPLDSLTYLTSTFGEYRDGYFHAGLDFGTFGRVGMPVRAIDGGSVVRIRASGVGYGRAVYFRSDEGPVAVYAHLNSFAPELAAYVEGAQDRAGRYEVDLYPDEGRFRFEAGEEIARSGASGAGPAHLHFEVRNAGSDIAVNPERHGFVAHDDVPPRLNAVWVSPATFSSTVNDDVEPVRISLDELGPGRYLAADTVAVSGSLVLSAEAYDVGSDPKRRLGVYRMNLLADGAPRYQAKLDSVPWADKREVDLVYQRDQAARGNPRVRRLYRPEGSTLDVHHGTNGVVEFGVGGVHRIEVLASDYSGNVSRAELVCRVTPEVPFVRPAPVHVDSDPTSVNPHIAVSETDRPDADGLRGTLRRDGGGPELTVVPRNGYRHMNLYVTGRDPLPDDAVFEVAGTVGYQSCSVARRSATDVIARFSPAGLAGPLHVLMASERSSAHAAIRVETSLVAAPGGEPLRLEVADVVVQVPAEATFDDHVMWAEMTDLGLHESIADGIDRVSGVVRVAPEAVVLQRSATVSFAAPSDVTGVGVYRRHPTRGTWGYVGGTIDGDRILATTRRMGEFALVRDLSPPVISRTDPRDGRKVSETRPRVGARIGDAGSGFTWRDLEIELDGKPLIAEWDPESGWLRGRPRLPLAIGAHSVTVKARDRSGNAAQQTFEFTVWEP